MILGVPNEGCLIARLRNNILQRKILKTTDHVHFYTFKTLKPKIESAGFKILEFDRESFFLPHLRLQPLLSCFGLGRATIDVFAKLFPTQSAGLYFLLGKEGD